MNRAELEDELEMQRRIVLMLLRLAVLAESLCLRPLPVRFLVLLLLRPAEAFVRVFAVQEAGGALVLPPAVSRIFGDGCAEALRLARSFRALAAYFGGLHDFGGWRLLHRGLSKPLQQCAPAIAWRSHALTSRRTMAFQATGRIDTS